MSETRTLVPEVPEAQPQADTADQRTESRRETDSGRDRHPELAFIDGSTARISISIVVFLNLLVLAIETDFPEWGAWIVLDNVFLLFYLLELALHVCHRGLGYAARKEGSLRRERYWAVVDIALAVIGVVELWIITPIFGWHSQVMAELRLSRLLRVFRIFKLLPKLTAFLYALASMLAVFFWVFLVLFLTLVASAIAITDFVNRESGILDDVGEELLSAEDKATSKAQFKSVMVSIFTLFRVVTVDNWNDIAWPLTTSQPCMRFFFVVFIAFASWTLISVLTGVASDEMIAATSNKKEMERLEQEKRQKEFIKFLRKSFYDADADGNGVLDKEEFETLMKEPSMKQTMSNLGLEMTLDELSKAWSMLDVDSHGELTIDDFVEGLSYLQEQLSVKHIISIDYSVKRTSVRLEKCLDHLLEELIQVGRQSELIMSFLVDQEELHGRVSELLSLWSAWAGLVNPNAVSPKRRDNGHAVLRKSRPQLAPLPTRRLSSSEDTKGSPRLSFQDPALKRWSVMPLQPSLNGRSASTLVG